MKTWNEVIRGGLKEKIPSKDRGKDGHTWKSFIKPPNPAKHVKQTLKRI